MSLATALLVEGDGDVLSLPSLFRSSVNFLGLDGCVHPIAPIKVGDPTSAIKSERFIRMFKYAIGASSNNAVIVCLDSDDYCPFVASEEIYARIREITDSFQKPVGICLFEREFESMFLADIERLQQGRAEIEQGNFDPTSWSNHRDAKGVFSSMLKDISYKETRDQVKYTALIDLESCRQKYRPLLHFHNILEWISMGDFSRGYLSNLSEYHFEK
jgi:hypothetical protein